MIAKMRYINISGHINSMNHVINNYLSRYDIQLTRTNAHGLMEPFSSLNPYTATLQKAEYLSDIAGQVPFIYFPLSEAGAVNMVEEAHRAYEKRDENLRTREAGLSTAKDYIRKLQDFASIQWDISELEKFMFTHYRFGKLPVTHFLQYEKFLSDDNKIMCHVVKRDNDFVWVVYFTPCKHKETTDAVFAALKFEPIDITDICSKGGIAGTPAKLIQYWQGVCTHMEEEILLLTHTTLAEIIGTPQRLAIACAKVKNLYRAFDLKKFADISPGGQIFSFSGWMTAEDTAILETEIDGDNLTILTFPPEDERLPTPPTLLKNPPFFKQFEFLTGLYGLPSHGEIDPTPVLAVTYTMLFGLMFGDVGHGAVLAVMGMWVRHKWKSPLGGIMAAAGVSAALFGFLYGSIFGFEDMLTAFWRRPAQDIGGTLVFAAILGVGLITISMVLNMYNSFKQQDIGGLLFGANGAAGLVFYGALLYMAARIFIFGLPITGMVAATALFPLVFVAFKLPLERLMDGQSIIPPGGTGQFLFNTIIQLFETLLTYLTNTISFVRVGAFAISHAGMMHVVLQLSQTAAGTRNWIILIMGNVLVLVIEGLLVGIQVLRLNFYEMFSRFYTGGGERFTSHKIGDR
ncbi:MAG: hypothetical protein FWC32_01465 [Firmicutes bacterium]|nr:hypothetical protein [Bacillota bacterium]